MTGIDKGNAPPPYNYLPSGLPANPAVGVAAGLARVNPAFHKNLATPSNSYVKPELLDRHTDLRSRGENAARHKLAKYVNDLRENKDPVLLARVVSPLSEAELKAVDAFKDACQELNLSLEKLIGLAQRCAEFVRTAGPTQLATAGEEGGLLYNIKVEVEKIKKLLEDMITLNSRLRYDQIDRRFGSIRRPEAPRTLQPAAGETPSTFDDVMRAKQEVRKGLVRMLECMHSFLEFSRPERTDRDLFGWDSVQESENQAAFDPAAFNQAVLEKAASTFSENLLPDEAAKLMAREVNALNFNGLQQVAVRSLKEKGGSSLRIFYVKNILLPFKYVFNREKLLAANNKTPGVNNAAATSDIDKAFQEFLEKKSGEETDSEEDDFWG